MNSSDIFRKRAAALVKELTLEEKLKLLTTHHFPVERLGLKEFFIGTEVARGFVGRSSENYSTVFPQPVGLAGTFDTELMKELGAIAGDECRAYYNEDKKSNLCVWGPTVDMERDPRWGRTEEAYGEDVCLAGEMTRAYTEGLAGETNGYFKTIPTLKHFCANNNEKHRGSCDAYLPLRLKYEYYYAAFMNAIKYGGARSVMTAYNEINGIPALCNPELESVLKKQWGLWFAVTDGGDFSQTVTAHRYCQRHSEALAESLKAGCDTMTDSAALTENAAREALAAGLITEADIDRAVENTLYARLRLGQLSDDCPFDSIGKDVLHSPASEQTCLRAAKEQIVLLKNDGILPLKKSPAKIAVVGALCEENLMDWYTGHFHNAVSPAEGMRREFPDSEIIADKLWDIIAIKAENGKYLSVHEDGTIRADTDSVSDSELFELQDWGENWKNLFSVKYKKYLCYADDTLKLNKDTVYDWFTRETLNFFRVQSGFIIEEYLGHQRLNADADGGIIFKPGRAVTESNTFQIEYVSPRLERAEKIAAECEYVFFCIGNHPVQVAKECYDRKTLALNIQIGIADHLYNCNKNTVMVLISSYPYSTIMENKLLPAILYTTHAGAHLGTALAETISGKNNPAGRLAMTWYRSELDLPDIMNYDIESGGATYMYFKGKPLYPFGYGLSYSRFEYVSLKISSGSEPLTAEATVKNVSGADGDEVVQLYYTVPDSAVSRPIKKLCAFARVHIPAGKTVTVRLTVPGHILQIYDVRRREMITEAGKYVFMAGGSSAELPLTAEHVISGDTLALRADSFEAQTFDCGKGVSISWSRKLKKHYVHSVGWSGTAIYGGCRFTGKSSLKITASAFMGGGKLSAEAAGVKTELELDPSDGYDDLRGYRLPLPAGLPDTGELILTLPPDVCIFDISLD